MAAPTTGDETRRAAWQLDHDQRRPRRRGMWVAVCGVCWLLLVISLAVLSFAALERRDSSWQAYIQQQDQIVALQLQIGTGLGPAKFTQDVAAARAATAADAHPRTTKSTQLPAVSPANWSPEDLYRLDQLRDIFVRQGQRLQAALAEQSPTGPARPANHLLALADIDQQQARALVGELTNRQRTQANLAANQAQTAALVYGVLGITLAGCGLLGGLLTLRDYSRQRRQDQAETRYYQLEADSCAAQLKASLAAKQLTDERMACALDSNGDGTWDWDLITQSIYHSQRLAAMLGYSDEDLSDNIEGWSSRVHADDFPRVLAEIKANLAGTTREYTSQHRMRCKDGSYLWILDRGRVVSRDSDGKPLRMVGTYTDISSQKMASQALETALRETSALLKTLNLHAIVSVADAAGTIIDVNDAFCTISGYRRDELIGRNHRIVNSCLHPRKFWMDMWEDISRGKPWRGQVRNSAKNGNHYWVDTFIAPFMDAQGRVEKYISIRTDITAAKQQETELVTALRHSASLLDALNMHAIVSVADRAGVITDVNDAFCKISGYSRHELIGQQHNIVNSGTHPRQFWLAMWGDIANGWPWRNPVCNRAKDGSVYWVDTFIAPFRDETGRIEKYISIRTDVTAAKQQEANLRAARDQLHKAAGVARMGIWTWDIQSGTLEWNPRMHEIYASPETIIQSGAYYDFWRASLHPDDLEATEAKLLGAVAGTDVYDPYFRINTPSGETRYIQGVGVVEHDEQGRAVRVMGINIDITEQRQTEAILRNAKQAADDASKAKSDFLANMSHELRTPMNAILGMLALLNKTELTLRQADYTSKTESAARSLLALLNDILDLSKAEAGKMTLDPQPFALNAMLRDLSVILAANVSNKPVEVLFDVQPDVPNYLLGDAMRLQQVLVNLGGNAIKFTAQGEVVLSIRLAQLSADEAHLEFAVRDTGIGIAPENQAKIFSGFTQAEASTSRRFGGTGLGVAISQKMVALMGGQLQLHSTLGQGSCFYFSAAFPLAPPAAAAALPQATTWQVLVVDDNPATLEVIRRMTESFGWRADLAANGHQALDCVKALAAQGQTYQAVFMDWRMPDMDGWETSRHIRALDPARAAPIIIMITAYDREMLAQRSETEQVLIDGFLVKPITASMLLDAIVDVRAEQGLNEPTLANPPAEARLQGMRILLVEDNLTNQQVAYELLESEGAQVQIANHGKEALDILEAALGEHSTTPVDAVLMDVQMPIMDGFTATKRIRHDLQLHALPIVAMTANAMASDREACLQAGMNDHIGKPFNLEHLVKVLLQRTGWQPATRVTPAPAAAASADTQDFAQLAAAAGVNSAAAITRLGGNSDLYMRLLPTFLANVLGLPSQLRAELAQEDFAQLGQSLHSFKGLAGTMGQDAMASLVAQLEKQFLQDPAQRHHTIQALCTALDAAAPALQALQASLPAAKSP